MSKRAMRRCAWGALFLMALTCLAAAGYRWQYRKTLHRMLDKGDALYEAGGFEYAVLVEEVVAKAQYGPKWAGGWELLFRYALEHQASPMASSIMVEMFNLEMIGLGRVEDGMKLARELLSSPNPSVRAEAARVMLYNNDGIAPIHVLQKLMHDGPPSVRQNATRLLGHAGHWEAVEQLRGWVLSGPGEDEETRYAWVDGLSALVAARATDEPVLRVCRKVIGKTTAKNVAGGTSAVWRGAADAVIMARDREGILMLADILEDGPEEAARDASFALSWDNVVRKGGRWNWDPSPVARKKAAERVREWLQKQDR